MCSGQGDKTERGMLAWEGSWQGKSHQAARGMLGWVNSPEFLTFVKTQLRLKRIFSGVENELLPINTRGAKISEGKELQRLHQSYQALTGGNFV